MLYEKYKTIEIGKDLDGNITSIYVSDNLVHIEAGGSKVILTITEASELAMILQVL